MNDPNDKIHLISLVKATEERGFNPDCLGQLARKERLRAQNTENS